MNKTATYFLLSILSFVNHSLCAPQSYSHGRSDQIRVKRQEEPELIISKFHVDTKIQFRYAVTTVTSLVKNPGTEARRAEFSMIIPDTAFISNMSMVIKGEEYVSSVQEKKEAQATFDEAISKGFAAGLVSKATSRDTNKFTVDANIEAGDKVVFKLTYEELLERKNGQYEYTLNMDPGQLVEDLRVTVNIAESLPLTKLEVPALVESNEIDFSAAEEEVSSIAEVTRGVNGSENSAKVVFAPDREYQEAAGDQGVSGKFVVRYDVDRDGQESEVQVIDGYFVHYFVPENLPTLPKHVVFVLDISGSMRGEKLEQMKDAMFTVLDDMTDEDFFNIVTFSTDVEHWNKEEAQEEIFSDDGFVENITTEFYRATDENKNIAIGSILDLQADGGTNINDALLAALAVGKDAKQKGAFPADVQTMVVFLTDGNPSSGVTDKSEIKSNVKSANTGAEFPVFTIAFGEDADFNLVKDIAAENDGAAKRIYEGSDAALQLENFYAEISSPLLSNLRLQYVGGLVDTASLSETEAKTLFRGREVIVAGKLFTASMDADRLGIKINADGKGGKFHKHFDICLRDNKIPVPSPLPACLKPREYPKSEAQNFLKNLHAFLNIKQLLKKSKLTSNETEQSALEMEATKLALETNLVTEVTSLVVTRPDEEPVINKLVTELLAEGDIPNWKLQYSNYYSNTAMAVPGSRAVPGSISGMASVPTSVSSNRGTYSISSSNSGSYSSRGGRRGSIISSNSGSYSSRGGGRGRMRSGSGGRSQTSFNSQTAPPVTTTTTMTTTSASIYEQHFDSMSFDSGLQWSMSSGHSSHVLKDSLDIMMTSDINGIENSQCNGTLTLFTKTYNRGEELMIEEDSEDLEGFDNKAVTALVSGDCCWDIFSEQNFAGARKTLRPGEKYTGANSLGRDLFRNVSSVRRNTARRCR